MANVISTFKNAIDAVYLDLTQDPLTSANSTVYPLERVKEWINYAQMQALTERHYSFMTKDVFFNNVIDKTTTAEILAGATTIPLNSITGNYTSGSILIDEDLISYTGISSTNLTTVSGVGAIHATGSIVRQVYSLSTNLSITSFEKPISLTIDGREIEYYDYNGIINNNGYTIFDGKLYLPFLSTKCKIRLRYKKSPTVLSADADVLEIPPKHAELLVQFAVGMCHAKVDDSRAADSFRKFEEFKQKMRRDYAEQTEKRRKNIPFAYKRTNNSFIWNR